MKKNCFLLVFMALSSMFTSCAQVKSQPQNHDITYVKSLEKNLKKTEKNLKESEKKVAELRREIALVQIKAIHKQIENYKMSIRELSLDNASIVNANLFLNEREVLTTIIESDPHLATSAQAVLDQILALITTLNNCQLDPTIESNNSL